MSEFTDAKGVLQSSTIRAALIGLLVMAHQVAASFFGLDLGLVHEDIAMAIDGILTAVAFVMVIVGRLKAKQAVQFGGRAAPITKD